MAERFLDCRNLTAYFYKWWQTTLGEAQDASDSKQRETAIREANGFRRAYFTARKWLYEHTDVPETNIHALIENKHGGSSIPIAPARRALEALDEQGDNLKLLAFMWEHYPAQCKAIELPRPEIHACALAWADRHKINAKLAAETNAATGQGEPQPAGESGPESPTGFLGGTALANALGVHPTRRDAFFRQLERQRMGLGDDCWHEVRDPRPNSPRFLYRTDAPKLRDLAAGYKTPKPA